MKPSVIIALVVVGGLVIVAPLICDSILSVNRINNLTRILEGGAQSANLEKSEVGSTLTMGCWASGSLMVVAGVVLAFRLPNRSGAD